jgi:Mnd1 HTH domain
LKELEKIAPQQKKIPFQSVKEILQSLVDDNIVPLRPYLSLYLMTGFIRQNWHYNILLGIPITSQTNRRIKNRGLDKGTPGTKRSTSGIDQPHPNCLGCTRKYCNTKQYHQSSKHRQEERRVLLETLQQKEQSKQDKENELLKYKDCDPKKFEEKGVLQCQCLIRYSSID